MKHIEAGKNFCFFLEKKISLLNQYLSLTRRMEETLKGKEENTMQSLIAQRRECAQKIDKVDRHLNIAAEPGGEMQKLFPEKLKKIVDGYLQTLKNIMEALAPLDRRVMVLAKQECDDLKAELLRRRTVRAASEGYNRGIGHTSRFLDTRR